MKIARSFSLRKKKKLKKKTSGENVVTAMAPIMEEDGAANLCVGSTHERGSADTQAKAPDVTVEKAAATDDVVTVPNDAQLEVKETDPVLAHNDKSAMIMQAVEVAKEEAAGTQRTGTQRTSMLGDMEVTLNTIEPKDGKGAPSPPPSAESPKSHFELNVINATHRQISMKKNYSTSLMDENRSISSEEDLTGRNLEESFVAEDGLSVATDVVSCAGWTCASDAVSTIATSNQKKRNKVEDDELTQFVDDMLSPITSAADSFFSAMKCAFPKAVGEVDEVLSSDLHHLIFSDNDTKEGVEGVKDADDTEGVKDGASTQLEEEERDDRGVGYVQEEEVEMVLNSDLDTEAEEGVTSDEGIYEVKNLQLVKGEPRSESEEDKQGEEIDEVKDEEPVQGEEQKSEGDKQGEEGLKSVEGGIDEEEKNVQLVKVESRPEEDKQGEGEVGVAEDEVDEEVKDDQLAIGEQRSEEVGLLFEAHLENAAYSPGKGLVRKVGKLPQLLEDEVLIRVDATTISTRDCLEKLRRNNNKELFEELWVPGHEIVGRVVRAGTNSNAKSLSGKRIAALLPYGGGCSQYVRIKVKDAIELPKDAGSNDVVALLSTYMAAYQCLESVIEACLKVDGEGDDESGSIATNDNGQKESPLAGKNVMIYGAGSPAGLALVDLARSAGATVYAVSQKAHVSTMRDLGAYSWYGLNQRKVWEVKWKGTFDAIIDTVGDSHNYPSFFKVMKTRGRFARLNTTSCEQKHVEQMEKRGMWFGGYKELSGYEQRVFNDKTIDDYDIFHSVKKDKDVFEEDLAHLFQLLQAGNIKPKIVSRVGFDGLEGEWEKIMAGGTSGVAMVLPGANDDVFFYV